MSSQQRLRHLAVAISSVTLAFAAPAVASPPEQPVADGQAAPDIAKEGELGEAEAESKPEADSEADSEADPGADSEAEPETAGAEGEKEPPWSRGVSPEQRARAQQLLDEGNELFLESRHREALDRYEQAARAWNHPAIRFNIARALIVLDRPVEAYAHLEAALEYGKLPLADQVHLEAENYRRLLDAQLAEIAVRCDQPAVEVTLDGEDFLRCPGVRSVRVRPGRRLVVGTREGFLTASHAVTALPGETERVDLALVAIGDATVMKRRFAAWKPWAAAGGGAALVGVGVLFQRSAKANYDRYGRELEQCDVTGCLPEQIPESTRSLEARARLENRVAIASMATGGLLAVAGTVLVFLNQPRAVVPDRGQGLQVVPAVSSDGLGLGLRSRF